MANLNQYKTQLEANFPNDVVREQALSSALTLGLPQGRMENWRYTNLKPIADGYFQPAKAQGAIEGENLPAKTTPWPRLVFVNGLPQKELSDPLPTGLKTQIAENSELCDKPDQVFECFNIALNNGGLQLVVPNNTKVEGLEVLFLFDGSDNEAVHLRNAIYLEKGASLSIHMHYYGQDRSLGWLNASNNIVIEKDATLTHYSHIQCTSTLFANIRDNAKLNGGKYENHSLLIGSASARHEISFVTMGEQSEALLNGAFLGAEGETLDTLTQANHMQPNCHSEQFFKGIVAGGGKATFQGRVFVEKDAQKTIANQSCKNIILDRSAEANVKPELLIYADDVKCAHGTTVGELDENAQFYLEQRGVSPSEAKALLVNAFLEEIIDKMPAAEIQACFRDEIAQWMSQK